MLAVLHPSHGQRFRPGAPLHVWAALTSGTLEEEPEWYINDERVGEGLDAWLTTPGLGEYELELRAAGAEAVKVQIIVEDRDSGPRDDPVE